jgi:hypothetical protein
MEREGQAARGHRRACASGQVGHCLMDTHFYSPVKNNLADAAAKVQAKVRARVHSLRSRL